MSISINGIAEPIAVYIFYFKCFYESSFQKDPTVCNPASSLWELFFFFYFLISTEQTL